MENTTKASAFDLHKTKIAKGAALILFTFVTSHAPVMDGCFPTAAALVTYMVYRKPANLYLILPAAAGILPYIAKGYDPWGDIAAVVLCGLMTAMTRKFKLTLWQAAMMAASIGIVCTSISRLATVTIYKTSPEKLVMLGLLIFVSVFLLDVFYSICTGASAQCKGYMQELPVISVASLCLIVLDGLTLSFLAWPMTMFLTLAAMAYSEAGAALLVTVTGGIWAALMDQGQWGLMATMAIGVVCAMPVKRLGGYLRGAVFIAACWVLGTVESGVVLGADKYCLILAASVFAAVNWKFGKRLQSFAAAVSGSQGAGMERLYRKTEDLLRTKASDMEEMAELYGTYLDSRSVLSGQFDIMKQIFDSVRRQVASAARNDKAAPKERFDMDIAVSQCAASGSINGDCCGWQDIGDDRVAMVVSDGMGKGKKAASESLMVTKTIMALLRSGVTADLTLKMINTVMLIKDDEDSYATVDMVIVDKRSGKAKFYKIGAAPTLIRRKGRVEEVRLSTVPLGIVNGLKIRYMETAIKKDDWIIMMSDGISDGGGGNDRQGLFLNYLKEAASKVRSDDPKIMSTLLMDQAADSYIGRERDDMTVMVAKII